MLFNESVDVTVTDTSEWLQPSVSGSKPAARGVHTATLVGNQFVLYGGSSDFDEETMQCQEYYGDVHLIDKGKLLIFSFFGISLFLNLKEL